MAVSLDASLQEQAIVLKSTPLEQILKERKGGG